MHVLFSNGRRKDRTESTSQQYNLLYHLQIAGGGVPRIKFGGRAIGDEVAYVASVACNTRNLLFILAGIASISLIGPLTASRGPRNNRTIGFAGAGRAFEMTKKPLSKRRTVSAIVAGERVRRCICTANREDIVGEPIFFLLRWWTSSSHLLNSPQSLSLGSWPVLKRKKQMWMGNVKTWLFDVRRWCFHAFSQFSPLKHNKRALIRMVDFLDEKFKGKSTTREANVTRAKKRK